jgi:hypothetical protein
VTKRWLKLDQNFPFTRTSVQLRERFGNDGLLVWVCMLTAAKRGDPEGTIEHVNDPHFWVVMGLAQTPPVFTPDEFLTFTGQLKQTRRRRSGDVVKTTLTHWGDWQETWRREDERERKSRYRQGFVRDTAGTANGQPADEKRTEKEKERESITPLTPHGGNPAVREIFEHWQTARHHEGSKLSDGRRRKIEARLKEFSQADLLRAIDAVALDPWEERRRNDDLTQIFRSTESVDRFLAFDQDPALMSAEDRWKRHFAREEHT